MFNLRDYWGSPVVQQLASTVRVGCPVLRSRLGHTVCSLHFVFARRAGPLSYISE